MLPTSARAGLRGRQARQPPPASRSCRAPAATGLTDGAVPLRHGILVDVKLMNRILEIDHEDRTVTVQPGDQHAQAQRGAAPARLHLPRRSRVLPVLAGRRAHRHERLVADRRPLRPHARPRDLVRDRAADRRDHPRRRRRRAQGPQVLERLPAQAPVHGPPGDARDRHRGDARAGQPTRGGVLGVPRLPGLHGRLARDRRAGALGRRDAGRRRAVRRVEARVPAPRRRGLHPAARLGQGRDRLRVVRQRRRGPGRRQAPAADRARRPAAPTSATRSRRATGRRATTATRRRSTGARATGRSR